MDNNTELRTLAVNRLTSQADFRRSLGAWAGVSTLLLAIWGTTSLTAGHPLYFWPAWPIAAFAIAAIANGFNAYGPGQRGITEADIDAEVARLSR
jgi:hypothetical protein